MHRNSGWKRCAGVATLFAALAAAPLAAHSQNVMNILNSLGGGLGSAITGGKPAPAAQGDDLISLLTQSMENIDEAKEIEIGRQLAALLLGAKPAHPDMALQRYVNRLGRWISLQSPRPGLPWTFVVLDDPGYNAFAAPGGYVFVTKGLIDRCADESELAGILAHEITHVTSKHHLQAIRQSAMAGVGTQLLASQIRTSNMAGQLVKDQLLSLFRTVYTKGLSQSDEFEADRSGVAMAAKAGFDPYGLVSVLQQLRTVTPDNPMFTLTMSTHPAAQARLDYLEQSMGRQLDGLGGSRATIAQRLGGGNSAPPAPAARPAPAKKAG
ncbi:M48 family metallopeptidase [Acidovorax sp. FJL06]|uniref:M48 family metallopeptidase n=1 Tax=Acidovorax sp. FJL06 TaxID=2153365 RepID=UPI001F1A2523|nr:M48 family metallopeptidase [Acidovorax sp. FJL06]